MAEPTAPDRSAGTADGTTERAWQAAQLVLALYTARTFLPTAYDLLVVGRPAAGLPPSPTSSAAVLTQVLSIAVLVSVLAFLTHTSRLSWPRLGTACGAVLALELAAAAQVGHVALVTPLLSLLVLLVALNTTASAEQCLRVVRRCLSPVVVGSLLLALLHPQLAKYGMLDAPWGTREARLAGLTSQPNTLGAVAGLLCVTLLSGTRSRSAVALFSASSLALYLSQSYTCWFATCVAAVVVVNTRREGSVGAAIMLPVTLTVGGGGLWALARSGVMDGVATVNGRTLVWDLVLEHWTESPVLGHGPLVWGAHLASGTVPPWAVHAHNQALNTLYVSGAAGLAVLVWMVVALLRASRRAWAGGWGLPAGLVTFQLIRSYSEVPFQLYFGGFNVLVLALIASAVPARTEPDRSVTAAAPIAGEQERPTSCQR